MAINIEKSALLLVEGKDEVGFFGALADHLNISNKIQIEYYEAEKSNLRIALQSILLNTNFRLLTHLGIVSDADYSTDALNSIQSAIEQTNRLDKNRQLPMPEQAFLPFGDDTLKVSALILPGEGLDGMLEDLILQANQDDPAMACVKQYFTCLAENDIPFIQERVPKVKTQVFLASKVVSIRESKRDNWLKNIYTRDWWSWDNPSFDQVKAFLQQMVS